MFCLKQKSPFFRAQAEVYKSDFDAERRAREEIAGEKADLLEEIHRLKQLQNHKDLDNVITTIVSFKSVAYLTLTVTLRK